MLARNRNGSRILYLPARYMMTIGRAYATGIIQMTLRKDIPPRGIIIAENVKTIEPMIVPTLNSDFIRTLNIQTIASRQRIPYATFPKISISTQLYHFHCGLAFLWGKTPFSRKG